MVVSSKIKESIKTALAMTIAYGIALSLNWDRPMWAGFAVAFISLATVGQSFNKAAMRMLGTFLAIGVAFIIIATTSQDRWIFITLLAAYIGFCTYMMSGAKHNYFWNVSGFVCAIICFHAGPSSENAFSIAALRAQETGLGILVYSIIALLIWPSNSRNDFYAVAHKLALTHCKLFQTYVELISSPNLKKQALESRFQEIQIRAQFNSLLEAAETDSQEVKQKQQLWRKYQSKTIELVEIFENLRNNIKSLHRLDVNKYLLNYEKFIYEINNRLEQIANIQAGKSTNYIPADISLSQNKEASYKLLNFQKAALALTVTYFQKIEIVTSDILKITTDLDSDKCPKKYITQALESKKIFILDYDRLAYAVRIIFIMFLAFFSVIYIDGMPTNYTIVTISTVFGMFISTMPQLNVWLLLKPALFSISFSGLIYIFLMPQLSSYMTLGPLIFAITFAICYLFSSPKQALGRTFGLAMFIVITGIDNQQSYSFLTVANTMLVFPLAFFFISITAYLPVSWIPRHVISRLLKRYFFSCAYVISTICDKHQPQNFNLKKYKNNFHNNEIIQIPGKLHAWVNHISIKDKSGATTEQLQELVNSINALTLRVKELHKFHNSSKTRDLTDKIKINLESWCQQILLKTQNLSKKPEDANSNVLRGKLDEKYNKLEQLIQNEVNIIDNVQLDEHDSEYFHRLLGAYRGVSEALVDYSSSIEVINWHKWHEERFT